MSSWLDSLVLQHEELESPRSFWFWSGIAAISAVVKDSIWMDRQIYNLYPNVYIMLHAESGMKKGPPISMAKQLVAPAKNTKIISGRSSVQGILKELGSAQTQPGGKISNNSTAFICSSELSSSIVEDKVATTILTDLYDRQYNIGQWQSLLKMETFQLKNPTITMLTATNEAMSEDFFTKSAIQGGYFARTFIIYEKKRKVSNSLTYQLENKPNYILSSEYLKELAKIVGPFKSFSSLEKDDEYRFTRIKSAGTRQREVYFNETGAIYDDWYENFLKSVDEQEITDPTGTLNRFGDSVLKVAMLLSLSESADKIIKPETMYQTITECEKLIGNVRRTTHGKSGISNSSVLKNLIIMELLNRETHQVTRTVLLKKYWMHFEAAEEFDNIMQSFDAAGMIKTNSIGNQIVYHMPDGQVEELKRFMSGKSR